MMPLWLDALPPSARRGLLAATAALLGGATFGLGALQLSEEALDGGAAVAVLGSALLWIGCWITLARPELARRQAEARAQADEHAADRGLLVAPVSVPQEGAASLSEGDPAFSLPELHDRVRSLVAPEHAATVRLGDVSTEDGRTRVVCWVRTPGRAHRVALSRPAHATSAAPGTAPKPGQEWQLDEDHEHPFPDRPALRAHPGMAAARRALLLRAEAFDLPAFEALVVEIDDALTKAETATDVGAYTTTGGAREVEWFLDGVGLPPSDGELEWLDVEEDGWYERIEMRRGMRVIGLLRPSGQPAEPWRVWRIRSVS